jgi:hypothetical protein
MSEQKRNTRWQSAWLETKDANDDVIGTWCDALSSDDTKGFCTVCSKSVSVAAGGIAALKAHARTALHLERMKAKRNSRPISSLFNKVDAPLMKDEGSEAIKAEIRWTLHVVQHHQTFRSVDHYSATFTAMFTDSKIPKNMSIAAAVVSCGPRP